ncbi:MAG: hypothetical protein IPM16_15695 [Chloroflexi bacterium]|nr:hypothetical protein [Chloroflexota bacterium]
MAHVFVVYRRTNPHPQVKHVVDALVAAHGPQRIVTEISGLRGATGYRQEVAATIARSAGVIVVLGPDFISSGDALGRGLLDDREDPLRIEIAAALKMRPNGTYFALVGGLEMPPANALPPPLRAMPRTAWVMLGGGNPFEEGVQQFVTIAAGLLSGSIRRTRLMIAAGVAVFVLLCVLFAVFMSQTSGSGGLF